jgi:hypothetical protein
MSGGRVHRCHPHDPSWQNWPTLGYAVLGNIEPGLSTDQQVLQPVLLGSRPLMEKILRRIAKVGSRQSAGACGRGGAAHAGSAFQGRHP